jgi:hypothetical protein
MSANFQQLANFIWSVADLLRGPYRPPQYERVMLPLTVLRRFDAVLAPSKDAVLKRYAELSSKGTRGLDPTNSPGANLNAEGDPNGEGRDSPSSAPLKPSGQEWLGEIPVHWRVERAKNLFAVRDERSDDGTEELLTVSHITGVTSRSEKDVYMFEADDKAGYKRCMPGDLAINTLWAWMGAMGISPLAGIVSPDYHVYTSKGELLAEYVDLLCRSWPRRFPGRARCSSTPVACTASTRTKPLCESSTSSIPATRRCCACGTSASGVIGRWGMNSWMAARVRQATCFRADRRTDLRRMRALFSAFHAVIRASEGIQTPSALLNMAT